MRQVYKYHCLIFSALLCLLAPAMGAQPLVLHIHADRQTLGMGRTVAVTATAQNKGRPASGVTVWASVNGHRWGASAVTAADGKAVLLLPLPNVGLMRVQVIPRPAPFVPNADWIWAAATADKQTVTFSRTFLLTAVPRKAILHITADDAFTAFLNGHPIASGTDFHQVHSVSGLQKWLQEGQNVLTVRAYNNVGPAGLLALLNITEARRIRTLATNAAWQAGASAATVIAPVGGSVWGNGIQGWPGLSSAPDFPVGLPLPPSAAASNTLLIHVHRRRIMAPANTPMQVGMAWEPWFMPLNAYWNTAEAVPLLGHYPCDDPDVIRQHALWLDDAGVNFVWIDWSNNVWGRQHWNERPPGVNELIHSTTTLLDTFARMRREGIPTPQVTLLLGLVNGPPAAMSAVNEEMAWVNAHYIQNPRYQGLWVQYEKKPLITVLNVLGPNYLKGLLPIDTSQFTVRWVSTRLETNDHAKAGFWSWMDGVIHPVPTFHDGKPEALTVTPAFFGNGGWLYPAAVGRRGGATYMREFREAISLRPRFLLINQWNEFDGALIGQGFGPKHDQYYDTYSAELSDDIEPTSPELTGYRGGVGWGFFYLNLTRALLQIDRGQDTQSTVLTVQNPLPNQAVRGKTLRVRWAWAGRTPPLGITVRLDGHVVARNIPGTSYSLALTGLAPGPHRLTVQAMGATTQFPLSVRQEDRPGDKPQPVSVSVRFVFSETP